MHISKFQPFNFKSFYEPEPIRLSPGFNIVTGQNSIGKTALLEQLCLQFSNKPHRSLRTIPKPGAPVNGQSSANVEITLNTEEIKDLLAGEEGPFGVACPHLNQIHTITQGLPQNAEGANAVLKWLFNGVREFTIALKFFGDGRIETIQTPSFGLYEPQVDSNSYLVIRFKVNVDRSIRFHGLVRTSPSEDFGVMIGVKLRNRIYRFFAERFNIGVSEFGNTRLLAPTATNLPAVLNLMNENPKRVDEFNELVRSVLPQVTQFSMRSISSTQAEILIWNIDPESKRADLAMPLNECGTGIGQVLAILYVAVNSELPQTILIDEPQSFLHPGAARKLIEILKEHPQHQYIVATHSPTIITAANPSTVTLLTMEEGQTRPQQMKPHTRASSELYLNEIGARLSDVFGADNVLWVEGRTEEICVPRILRKIANRPLMGTNVLGVRHTSDLVSRDAKKILEIYNQVSQSASLLPPTIAFVLDLETRNEQEQRDLKKLSRGLLRFTTRRTYENYLLNASAVAAVATQISGFRPTAVSPGEVSGFINEARKQKAYFSPLEVDNTATWMKTIDGAKLLSNVFASLSENRVTYDKVEHSVLLTDWILENSASDLQELSELYIAALEGRPSPHL